MEGKIALKVGYFQSSPTLKEGRGGGTREGVGKGRVFSLTKNDGWATSTMGDFKESRKPDVINYHKCNLRYKREKFGGGNEGLAFDHLRPKGRPTRCLAGEGKGTMGTSIFVKNGQLFQED